MAPTRRYEVQSAAAAILVDARTGFVYGSVEEGATRTGLIASLGKSDAMEAARKKAEREALDKLMEGFEGMWREVYARHGG